MGPDRRYDSFGLCFGPNGRFSTHFGPYLMFLDLTELWPMWPICPDGTRRALTEDSMDPYRCTTKIRTHTDPRRAPTSPDETQRDPIRCQHVTVSDNVRHGTPEPDHPPSGSRPQG